MQKESKKFGLLDKTIFHLINLTIFVLTVYLFLYLNKIQPTYYVDEVFHIPQTIKYCLGKYREWDPKITTLPAQYIISSSVLKPFKLCNTTWIRATNLVATFFNLYLANRITKSLHNINDESPRKMRWIQIAMSYNIAFLPPLFFWFFLYYTDVFSLTMILSMLLLHICGYFNLAAIPGIISILVRQTNIIWMFLLAAEYALDKIDMQSKKVFQLSRYERTLQRSAKRIWKYLMLQLRQGPRTVCSMIFDLVSDIWMYTLCGMVFFVFVIYNEGIVVGDRSAHKPTVHFPQIFYFAGFSFVFAWPYMIQWTKDFFSDIRKHWIITSFLFALMIVIVHNNTLVHQYLLADNRHYNFYFWNKLMKPYVYFKYILVPVYGFTMYSFCKCIGYMNLSKLVAYFCCLFIVLVPQLLLEPRYFIVPYIFFRLNLRFPKTWSIVLETLTIMLINFGQFYLFVNKTFYWKDLPEPQRIGW